MKIISNNNEELENAVKHLSSATYIAIDTEFHRESTYYPILALIQIYSKELDQIYIFDTVSDMNLSPLIELIYNKNILKIFHSGKQDLEIFYNLKQSIPQNIFDTQIAASVLGFGETIGYVNLAKSILNIDLKKDLRQSNWLNRPLSQKQLEYAANDVFYLADIYLELTKRLKELDRENWITEELSKLIDANSYKLDISQLTNRLIPSSSSNKYYTKLYYLIQWRENLAKTENLPRQHIFKDTILLDIAASDNENINFKRLRNIKYTSQTKKYIELLKDEWKKILSYDHKIFAQNNNTTYKNSVYEILKLLLKIQAEKHSVAEKIIANNDDILALSNWKINNIDNIALPLLKGWRYSVFGEIALKLLQGQVSIKVKNGDILLINEEL